MNIYVASVRDQDGYYIPVLASFSHEVCKYNLDIFLREEKDNDYWDKELYGINEVQVLE